MAQSDLDIINEAMALLGTRAITSRTQGITEAREADRHFNHSRDEVLRSHAWSSATKRDKLNRLAATDSRIASLHDYDYGYVLPADYVRMSPQCQLWGQFRIEGRVLVTSVDEANIVYISNEEGYYSSDPLLTSAIAALLASKIAMAIKGDMSLKRDLYALYQETLDEARYISDVDGGTGDSMAFNHYVQGGFNNPRQSFIRNDLIGGEHGP